MNYTAEQRQAKLAVVARWRESGLTQKEFCQQQKMPYHEFHYWYAIHNGKPKYKDKKKTSAFIHLSVPPVAPTLNKHIELIFPKGQRLIFYYHPEVSQLRQLMK